MSFRVDYDINHDEVFRTRWWRIKGSPDGCGLVLRIDEDPNGIVHFQGGLRMTINIREANAHQTYLAT